MEKLLLCFEPENRNSSNEEIVQAPTGKERKKEAEENFAKEETQMGTKQMHCFRNTKNQSKMVTLKSSMTPSQLKVKFTEKYQNSMKTYVPNNNAASVTLNTK